MVDSTQNAVNGYITLATLQREDRLCDVRMACRQLMETPYLPGPEECYKMALSLSSSPRLNLVLHGRLAELCGDDGQYLREFLVLFEESFDGLNTTAQNRQYFAVLLERLAAQCEARDEAMATHLLTKSIALLKQNGQEPVQLLWKLAMLEAQRTSESVPSSYCRPTSDGDSEPPCVRNRLAGHPSSLGSLFYPGAGWDWGPLRVFRKNVGTFFYVDYFLSRSEARKFLSSIPGLRLDSIESQRPEQFGQESWEAFWQEDEDRRFGRRGPRHSFIFRAELRWVDTGARAEVYYFGTEAIKTFEVLCSSNDLFQNRKPEIIVCQDHGFGGQWTPFGGCSLLYSAALAHDALPAFLYLGLEQALPWPQYALESMPQIDEGQQHDFPRALFARRLSTPQLPKQTFADIYDLAHKGNKTFLQQYDALTAHHLGLISELLQACPDGPILEVGAATGRLAVPLGHYFHRGLVALDSDAEMVGVLRGKLSVDDNLRSWTPGMRLSTWVQARLGKIEDFRLGEGDRPFALVLVLFNTMAHLQTKLALLKAIDSIWHALALGGHVLIDLPAPSAFRSLDLPMPDFEAHRKIELEAVEDSPFYRWTDTTTVSIAGATERIQKSSTIRQWNEEEVIPLFEARGFERVQRISNLEAFGSACFQLIKAS